MRVVAIDGSALAGGSVSAAVEATAEAVERAGGAVSRYRLYSMPTGHGIQEGGITAPRGNEAIIAATVEAILDADGIILGTPATAAGANAATRALLGRLAVCFAGNCLERGYHGRPTRLSPGRRVGLLTSTPSPTALASVHASTLGISVRTRRAFGRGGVKLAGHVSVADLPGHPLARDRAMIRAVDLGRTLAEEIEQAECSLPVTWELEQMAKAFH